MLSGTGKNGERGIKPIDLLSMSLGSCMAQSIIYYFQKNDQQLDDLEVNVKTRMKKVAPWSVTEFARAQSVSWVEIYRKTLFESLRVSEEELCGVTDVLRCSTKITNEYSIYSSKDVQVV